MNPKVDTYLLEGCGRCPNYRTPECKVHTWTEELKQLRRIVLESGLQEELKWSQPCYTLSNRNIVMVTAFKDYAMIAFFKGVLLKDAHGILTAPGACSQSVRQARFTNVRDILKMEPVLKAYLQEAIEAEKAGRKVAFKKNPEPVPEELQKKLNDDPVLKSAFMALTPGRQRGYILYFTAPKQSKTREARIEKCTPQILKGKGFHDR